MQTLQQRERDEQIKAEWATDLHGVFAVTIYGDKIRVEHYSDWETAIETWGEYDRGKREFDTFPFIKFYCVRAWDDPDWNTARYYSFETLMNEEGI